MIGASEMNWHPKELERIGSAEEIGPDVAIIQAAPEDQEDIDATYHAKYDRYGPRIVGSLTGPGSHAVTVRLVPNTGGE
jgi:hypothetical protein